MRTGWCAQCISKHGTSFWASSIWSVSFLLLETYLVCVISLISLNSSSAFSSCAKSGIPLRSHTVEHYIPHTFQTQQRHIRQKATTCKRLPRIEGIVAAVFSLGCFWGVLHPPIVQMYPLISVSEAAAPPIRMMACMQSQSVFNSNHYQTVIQIVK